MRKQLVLAGLTALFTAGAATPALADTGASAAVCDSLLPSCIYVGVPVHQLTGSSVADGEVCDFMTPPTVDYYCINFEIDGPVAAP